MSFDRDFAQDGSGEIRLADGDLVFDSGRDAIAADLRERCSLIYGEWFLAPAEGVRLFEDVIGRKGVTAPIVRAAWEPTILATPGVVSILSFDVTIDRARRTATVQFEVNSDEGLVPVSMTL